MSDIVFLRGYELDMMVGINSDEFSKPQKVCFNVDASVRPIPNDVVDIKDVFSYDHIVEAILYLAESGHIHFVEQIAERLASAILSYPRVLKVMVRVEKLDVYNGRVGVEIIR